MFHKRRFAWAVSVALVLAVAALLYQFVLPGLSVARSEPPRIEVMLATVATTVKLADGKPQVLDGPYGELKEQLGGYYLIDVPDLDAAISWAARCPAANHGVVEVRPIWEMQELRT